MIAQFALRLICGMSLMWALMPRRQVSSGFFRIQMLVVMGLGVLATLARSMEIQSNPGAAPPSEVGTIATIDNVAIGLMGLLGLLGFLGSAFWTLERRRGGECIGFVVLFVSLVLILAPSFFPIADIYIHDAKRATHVPGGPAFSISNILFAASEFANAGVLGGVVVGMLLGHWYLTAPTMSIEPLQRLNQWLGIAGVLRLLISTIVVVVISAGMLDAAQSTVRLVSVPKAWFSLRWFAGVIGPLVVSLMVWRILKYRNTQAATGVLFVGVILAFIGDMTAALLLRETGWPL